MQRPLPPAVHIGSLVVTGVDAATARGLGPAIHHALAEAAQAGLIRPESRRRLTLDLKPGAGARDIAAALARALGGGRGQGR